MQVKRKNLRFRTRSCSAAENVDCFGEGVGEPAAEDRARDVATPSFVTIVGSFVSQLTSFEVSRV